MNGILLLPAFLAGLFGNAHCLGMCGGLSGALAFSMANNGKASMKKLFFYQIIYNFARVSSYIFLGLIAGGLSQFISYQMGPSAKIIFRIAAGMIIVGLGFYLTGLWQGITILERWGSKLWQKLSPLLKRFMPVKSPKQAYAIGFLWGFLPCGLVYSALAWAAASQSMIHGMLIMAFFGLGTMPAMVATGVFARRLTNLVQMDNIRRASGFVVIFLGIWTMLGSYLPHLLMHHHHHH